VVGVEQWAEIRRMHFVKGLSIKEIHRRTGLHRQTIRRALRASEPPRYQRPARASKLDPFREEIHRLLREEPRHGSWSSQNRRVDLGGLPGIRRLDEEEAFAAADDPGHVDLQRHRRRLLLGNRLMGTRRFANVATHSSVRLSPSRCASNLQGGRSGAR
jgi:hypothetical protein